MAIKHIKTAVGADDPDPNKIQALDWNNSHTLDSQGLVIPVASTSSITTPSAGNVAIYTDNISLQIQSKDSSGRVSRPTGRGMSIAYNDFGSLYY